MPSLGLQNYALRPSGSFGVPWTASFPESLGKRWNFGPEDGEVRQIRQTWGKRDVEDYKHNSCSIINAMMQLLPTSLPRASTKKMRDGFTLTPPSTFLANLEI